jgi:aldose 1-epimerase
MTEVSTLSIGAGDLRAEFWPRSGLLGVSLRFRGEELLRRIDDLETAKHKGSTAGIPLLYPWANRLAALRYRAAGHEVALDPASTLLHFDEQGLPMHGVPWGQLCWKIVEEKPSSFLARLDWDRLDLLAVFPFPHHLQIAGDVSSNSLTILTTILADAGSAVPVSFGFHPYFGIPSLPRTQWRLELPAMRTLRLDSRGIPTGETAPAASFGGPLGGHSFDDGFALLGNSASFSLSGAGHGITVSLLEGFPYAQLFAPKGKDFVALEPMTAPTSALTSGEGLRVLAPGTQFRASFRITVHSDNQNRNLEKES